MILKFELEVSQRHSNFDSLGAVSYSPSIVTMALSCIISEIKWDIGRKSWLFHTPLHSSLREFPSEYCHPVWYGKTRMVGLPDVEKNFEYMCRHKTGMWQTDRPTDRHLAAAYASRGNDSEGHLQNETTMILGQDICLKLPFYWHV